MSTTQPGDQMPDGTVYVGLSPTDGRPLYAMPHDPRGLHTWGGAKTAATAETFAGHTDWRLPTKEELDMLYRARDAVGGFQPGWYWSSFQIGDHFACGQGFSGGSRGFASKNANSHVRCVRSG